MHQHHYVSIATYILLITLIIIYLYIYIYIYITVRIKLLLMPILSKIFKEQYNVDLKYIKLYCKYITQIWESYVNIEKKSFPEDKSNRYYIKITIKT